MIHIKIAGFLVYIFSHNMKSLVRLVRIINVFFQNFKSERKIKKKSLLNFIYFLNRNRMVQ